MHAQSRVGPGMGLVSCSGSSNAAADLVANPWRQTTSASVGQAMVQVPCIDHHVAALCISKDEACGLSLAFAGAKHQGASRFSGYAANAYPGQPHTWGCKPCPTSNRGTRLHCVHLAVNSCILTRTTTHDLFVPWLHCLF